MSDEENETPKGEVKQASATGRLDLSEALGSPMEPADEEESPVIFSDRALMQQVLRDFVVAANASGARLRVGGGVDCVAFNRFADQYIDRVGNGDIYPED